MCVGGIRVSEHRLVWATHNGPIPPGHCVHHLNGDRLDNRIENLECMTEEDHGRLHQELGHAVDNWGRWLG